MTAASGGGSDATVPPGMPPGPFAPPPKKSNTGLVVGVVAGVLAWVLVFCVGGGALAYHAAGDLGLRSGGASHSQSPRHSPSPTYSPSPSPSPTARDPYTLDDESTDETPMDLDQFFADDIDGYELAADSMYSVCSDAGGDATESLLRKHSSCGAMPTADYLDTTHRLVASAMVIPLSTSSDANAVESVIQEDAKNMTSAWTELNYFCPKNGTGSHACDNYPYWRAYYSAYHRYFLVVTLLRFEAGTTPDSAAVEDLGNAVLYGVEDQMLVLR